MTEKEIIDKMKDSLKDGIEKLLEQDIRKANIEIELVHYIKNLLKKD